MRRHVSVVLAGLLSVVSLSSCGLTEHPDVGADDGTASIVLALTMVPSDVQCLEVSVTGGGTTRTQLFSLTPGMATTVVVPGVPGGSVSISERAFAVACTAVTAATAPTWISVMPVMATLTPGQTADVTVVLRRAGQIRITNDFQDGQFIASQGAIVFGNVVVGTTPPPSSLTITNGGSTTATVPALTVTGANAGQFVVQAPGSAANPCTATTSLAPGAFCTTGVRFAPSSTGAKSATFVIGAIAAVSLSGTGVLATSVLMPSVTSLAFGNVAIGTGVTRSFTITNTGTAAVTLPSLLPGGADATQFLVPTAASSPCMSGASLAAGAMCTSDVRFAPTTTGQKVASLVVGTTSVALTGTAVTSTLTPSVTSLAFGSVALGTGVTMTFTVVNTGSLAATLPTLQASGADATQFIVPPPSGSNPCTSGASLAAGAMCTGSVRFAPTTTGQKVASLVVGATSIALTGTAVTAVSLLIPSVTSLMFPNTIVGGGSFSTMTFTITNTGTGAVTLPTLQASGADATQFIVPPPSGSNPCMSGASMAAGAMCTSTVRFFPTTTGLKAANLIVGTTSVSLRGTGI